MHYLGSHNIYFSTTYDLSVYDITYKTLGHINSRINAEADNGEYIPPKKGMELENNFSSILSSINNERTLETHEIFHPEK